MGSLFNTTMKNEKIAAILLVIITVGALSVYLTATYGDEILKNIFGEEKIVELGDCVDAHYIGRFATNNTIFDTSYVFTENKTGGNPLNIFVNPNFNLTKPVGYDNYSSGIIIGFQNGLIGMKPGENKNITIPPEEAYGDWDFTYFEEQFLLIFNTTYYPRYTPYNFTETQTLETFVNIYAPPDLDITNLSVNQTIDYDNGTTQTGENSTWVIKIINISDNNVTIQHFVDNNTIFNNGLWNSTIIVDNETNFRRREDPEIGFTFTGGEYPYIQHIKIYDVNETAIVIVDNKQAPIISLVGQTLIFEVDLIEVYKTADIVS